MRGLPIRSPADHEHVSFRVTDTMALFNKPDVYILPVMSQAQGVEFSTNQYEHISTRTGPPPSQMCRQQILQSNQQQLAYSWVPNESLNRPTMAPCSPFTTARISQYPGNQYAKDNPQGSQRERISELMNNIFLSLMYRKSRSIALDLKTLYRDAFATLKPATLSMVMGAWKDYIDNTQRTNYHGNGRSYELSINCLY
ncbi:uncharacterized protein N7469_001958 [Penicillium citrinum]|uniref:Uncharacterized protein n=1 Tax=Penicillium citrinum TaxID=5077 RepID=A0A9W9TT85_PENCI|nr:uncharacterized protein N7469_001958 [Penicillium citrinum]KAJ5240367.1 hypothetical protein N7469_001958 [Penicillium citrinum]